MEACTRKHLFIINPLSFRSEMEQKVFISGVSRCFEGAIKHECQVRFSLFPRHAVRIVRQYLARENANVRVYAVGGDGILFDCLNGIVGLPNAELATVPYGHRNDFMRVFGEGLEDVFRNISLQAAAPVTLTDILHCGSNYALNFCIVGMDSAAFFRTLEMQQRLRGYPPFIRNNRHIYNILYALGIGLALFERRTVLKQEYTITLDGEDLSGIYANINISNGPCCGRNKTIAAATVPNDGQLDVLMLKAMRTVKTIMRFIRYNQGRYDYDPEEFILKRGKIISIRSKDPLMINLDGELFYDTNITVELIPQAVKIVTPNNLIFGAVGPVQ
jgi:diacylglycerol kinase family enzyme